MADGDYCLFQVFAVAVDFAQFFAVVAVDFVHFDVAAVADFAGLTACCVPLELAAVHRIVASSAVDVAERESGSAVGIERLAHGIVDLGVAHGIAAAVGTEAARDIVEQRLDDNFGEFRWDVELDSDPVDDKKKIS